MIHRLVQIESHGHLHIFQTAIISQEECQSTDSNFSTIGKMTGNLTLGSMRLLSSGNFR